MVALAVALLPVTAAAAVDASPPGAACPADAAFTDPSGDTSLLDVPTPSPVDDAVDVVGAYVAIDDTGVPGALRFVVQLQDVTPPLGYGQDVRFGFTVDGVALAVVAKRPRTGEPTFTYGQASLKEAERTKVTGSFDDDADEVAVVVPFAVTAWAEGTRLTDLSVTTGRILTSGSQQADFAAGDCAFSIGPPAGEDDPPAEDGEPSIPDDDGPPVSPGDGVRYVDPVFEKIDITRGIRFGQAVNDFGALQQLRLDVYEPTGDVAVDRPAIVYAHGGGFVAGARDDDRQLDYLVGLARRGYVVLSIDYRIRPKGTPNPDAGANIAKAWAAGTQSPVVQEAQHDMQAAVRWTRAQAVALGVDPETIIVSGGSAGAITAWSTGVNPEDPGDSGTPGPSSDVAAVVSLWGAMSPHEMEVGAPPVLDVHGTKDVPVSLPLANAACARMISLLNQCEQYLLPNGKHPAWEYADDFFPEVTGFLCRTVVSSCRSDELVSPVRVGPTEPSA